MFKTLLLNDIWTVIQKYSFPGKKTQTFHTYRKGYIAVNQKYYKLILASPHLICYKWIDGIMNTNRTDIFDHLVSYYPLAPCSKQVCMCTAYSQETSAKILLHMYDYYCQCEIEKDEAICSLIHAIFRDKDIRVARPLSRLQKWIETVPDAMSSVFFGLETASVYGVRETALPLIQWFLKIYKTTNLFAESERNKFIRKSVEYALKYDDEKVLEWIMTSGSIDLKKLGSYNYLDSYNLLNVNSLEVLKKIGNINYIEKNLNINDYIRKGKTESVKWILRECKLENLTIPYNERSFWKALESEHYEMLDLLPGPTIDLNDADYGLYEYFINSNNRFIFKMLSDPVLKNWLQKRLQRYFPPTVQISSALALNFLSKRDEDIYFLREIVYERNPIALDAILSWKSKKGTLKSSYLSHLLSYILRYIKEVHRRDPASNQFLPLVICRCIKYHANCMNLSENCIDMKNTSGIWYNRKNTPSLINISHWFNIEYDIEILDPVDIVVSDNVEVLDYYFSKKDTRTTWDLQVEIENNFRRKKGIEENSWEKIIISGDTHELEIENMMAQMLISAGPDTLNWIVINQDKILESKKIHGDYSQYYRKGGPENILQLLVWSYRNVMKIEKFLEYRKTK